MCKQYKIKLCQIKHVALSAVGTSLWQGGSWYDQSISTTEYKVRFLQKNLMKLLMLIFLVTFNLINKSMTFHERWKTIPNLCMVVYMTTHTHTLSVSLSPDMGFMPTSTPPQEPIPPSRTPVEPAQHIILVFQELTAPIGGIDVVILPLPP